MTTSRHILPSRQEVFEVEGHPIWRERLRILIAAADWPIPTAEVLRAGHALGMSPLLVRQILAAGEGMGRLAFARGEWRVVQR